MRWPDAPVGFRCRIADFENRLWLPMPYFKMSEVAGPLGVDIWQMAFLMEQRYGDDAIVESAALAEHLLEDGDCEGAAMWRRIRAAVEWLQAKAPAKGESVH